MCLGCAAALAWQPQANAPDTVAVLLLVWSTTLLPLRLQLLWRGMLLSPASPASMSSALPSLRPCRALGGSLMISLQQQQHVCIVDLQHTSRGRHSVQGYGRLPEAEGVVGSILKAVAGR
jgi:hypothetical protein